MTIEESSLPQGFLIFFAQKFIEKMSLYQVLQYRGVKVNIAKKSMTLRF
jgi:hypothetical protein